MNYNSNGQPQIVYLPSMNDPRLSKSVSVIAIILLIALLFVGMKLNSSDGLYQKEDLDWNRGYINTETGKAEQKNWGKSYGMYTVSPIEIGKGVKIELKFDSKLTYQVLVYDANDKFLGTMGDPCASGQELKPDDFTGDLSTAKFIRLYAYEKTENVNGINPTEENFSYFDMITRSNNFTVSTLKESHFEENLEDVVS